MCYLIPSTRLSVHCFHHSTEEDKQRFPNRQVLELSILKNKKIYLIKKNGTFYLIVDQTLKFFRP
jgi:hypothetical protein